ncbi:Uncharacterized protein family UPF0497, trans-membrane plant [Cynara cardunculus var. scolymus]|uniref:CASP-like protein n=1 Tax=Cynara cardunculus var. scolymus TaxID=59895 RepID=A0A103Y1S8_CYNCS|nr:Uncharacterized protein family UPF0497, trans-membrane plant [Cynara cardunculus var. scolymus]
MVGEVGETAEKGGSIRRWRMTTVVPLLRVLALFATAAATVAMALNKETHTFTVATIGNTPVKITLTAQMFVIANGVATLYGLVMLALSFVIHKYNLKGPWFLTVATLDMVTIAVVSGAATAVAFMGELARNGNSHARWNKICDNFQRYCNQGSGAMLASYIGIFFLMLVNMVHIFQLKRLNNLKNAIAA